MESNGGDIKKAEIADKHLEQIIKEKHKLDCTEFPVATKLLDEELKTTQQTGRAAFDDRYIDVYNDKPIKAHCRVLFPSKDVPSEEECKKSGDPKYAHLSDQLHVDVSCVAPPAEAHSRLAFALSRLQLILVPDPPNEMFTPYDAPATGYRPRFGAPVPRPGPDSQKKVMGFLEKARNSMEFQPPTPRARFPQRPPPRDPYDAPFTRRGEDYYEEQEEYERPVRGGGFYPPRSAPYSRY